nr:hypothetical protein [Tanacetum cinerariifolium]
SKKIFESIPYFTESFIKSLLEIGDFITKTGCFGRRKELINEFRNKIISKLFVLNKSKETMLELKIVSSNCWNDNCILVNLGGCLELLSHSKLIGHRNYGRRMFFKIQVFNPLLGMSMITTFRIRIRR